MQTVLVMHIYVRISLRPHALGEAHGAPMQWWVPNQSFPIDRNTRFRVVDEINQGMDPTNERLIFEQIVRCSKEASPGRPMPQYFMVCSSSLAYTFFRSFTFIAWLLVFLLTLISKPYVHRVVRSSSCSPFFFEALRTSLGLLVFLLTLFESSYLALPGRPMPQYFMVCAASLLTLFFSSKPHIACDRCRT